ncbi:hypothetical protein QTP88_029894 [Uroleucon formosanum]
MEHVSSVGSVGDDILYVELISKSSESVVTSMFSFNASSVLDSNSISILIPFKTSTVINSESSGSQWLVTYPNILKIGAVDRVFPRKQEDSIIFFEIFLIQLLSTEAISQTWITVELRSARFNSTTLGKPNFLLQFNYGEKIKQTE